MPGVVVAVGGFASQRFQAATQKLAHIPAHASEALAIAPGIAIGWAGFRERADSRVWSGPTGDVYVLRYGHTLKDGVPPRAIAAADIVRSYLADGIASCFDYDGSFVIVVIDQRSQRLYVVPDRLSTLPLYYTSNGDAIVIGPEVKALSTTLGIAPSLSMEGVVGFLTAGYNIGTQTIFADIQRLELGKMLEIALDRPPQLAPRRFWKFDFGTSTKFTNRRDAEEALFESIKHGHRVLLADEPEFQVLLSGGADSRGILGACSALHAMPAKAVTWGLLPDVPCSDASISRSLAERFGVPWDFIETRTSGFVDNCEQWAYVSELSNDNFGWYAEGFGTLHHMQETGYSSSFIGDEAWGWHGFAFDEFQCYGKVLAPTVPPSLLALMHESRREAAAESYVANIRDTMRDCHDSDWNDRKDFLYLHGRVARFIFALGYNRGHATEHRRPFLTRAVLDVVRRLPAEFRTYKNLYRTMLKRHMPETMRVPYASVNSLPDWSYDLRACQPLRDCFLGLLHDPLTERGSLGALLDPSRYCALRDAYFAQTPAPMSREAQPTSSVIKSHILEMLWSNPNYKYLDRWKNARAGGPAQRSMVQPVDLLRRVAILVLLERQLNRLQAV